jgi:hypothetical protein
MANVMVERGHRAARDGHHQTAAWRKILHRIAKQTLRLVDVLDDFRTYRVRRPCAMLRVRLS